MSCHPLNFLSEKLQNLLQNKFNLVANVKTLISELWNPTFFPNALWQWQWCSVSIDEATYEFFSVRYSHFLCEAEFLLFLGCLPWNKATIEKF